MEFIPNTAEDKKKMLEAVGISSVEELFEDIPEEVLKRYEPLGIEPLTELELERELASIASENEFKPTECVSYLGGGVYDHFIPSIVNHIPLRSEFYTAYTPYQAEISQGTLTWMFEYQTMICELTGMDVANSSMYDGASALAEAMLMAKNITGSKKFLLAKSVNPHWQQVVKTYAWGAGLELAEIPFNKSGQVNKDFIRENSKSLGGVLIQSPNFFGVIEDLSGIKDDIGQAFLIVSVNPISLGILKPPADFGADIVVGEGQMLGNPLNFGGPLLGIFATRKEYMRRMPGRLSGQTLDAEGKIGYVMALQTREQHIRRERATSNICTNQALCALAATVYLVSLGKSGLRRLAELNLQKAHYLADRIAELDNFSLQFPEAPFFNEFVLATALDADELQKTLSSEGILLLGPAALRACGLDNHLLIAVTEKREKRQLDSLIEKLKGV